MNRIIMAVFTTLVFSSWVIAQDAEKRGLEILSLARKAIYKGNPVISLENSKVRIISFVSSDHIILYEDSKMERMNRLYREQYFSFGSQDKTKFYRLDYFGNKFPIDINLLAAGQTAGEWFGEIKRGKYIPFPATLYKYATDREKVKGYIESKLFQLISPIFLQFFEDIKVRYVGKAETPEGKRVNVVAITNSRPKETQFLFDEKTHELLATVYKNVFLSHYYFSDRKLSNGLLLPTKLTFKSILTEHDKDSKKLKRKRTVLQKSKIFVELNSKFEKDEFALPRNAKSLASRAKELEAIWKAK